MKYIISERQYNLIKEEDQEILEIPSLDHFDNDWNLLQEFLKKRGNPPYSIGGDLDLRALDIKSLRSLVSVGGYLYLQYTSIESLGNLVSVGEHLYLNSTRIESLGNLVSVGGFLTLRNTPIKSLGNLVSVGGFLDLRNTPISKTMSEDEIRSVVNVVGDIYL